ncbi:TPA: GNAT family N-acetyltransferase [Bacillus cereus]|nr:GNAT family N-acetyltransferase [Bacillus cereus]
MLTKIPTIMTKCGQKIDATITPSIGYTSASYSDLTMKFYDISNKSEAGTIAYFIAKSHSEKSLHIHISSCDAIIQNEGVGTAMMYSFYRWLCFNYPGYEFHISGLMLPDDDPNYLIAFYTKVGFKVNTGKFELVILKEEFNDFYIEVENRISDIYSTFLNKQEDFYIHSSQKKLLAITKYYNEMSVIQFIKRRFMILIHKNKDAHK